MDFYDVPVEDWPAYQQFALERLHLKVTAVTHLLLYRLYESLSRSLSRWADESGKLPMIGFQRMMSTIRDEWQDTFNAWLRMFAEARWQAASIALAAVARYHLYYFGRGPEEEEEGGESLTGWSQTAMTGMDAQALPFIEQQAPFGTGPGQPYTGFLPFQADLARVLEQAMHRLWSDNFTLSGRLWKLDIDSLQGIRTAIYSGLALQKSVWEIAEDLEKYLGANAQCPRWLEARLKLTPTEILRGDEAGLLQGDECQTRGGVAYNALRLARTELQIVHTAAVDALFAQLPWVKGERLYLNDLHPDPPGYGCECERIVGYPQSRVSQVLPLGAVVLPLHPNCMCYKIPENMTPEEFWDNYQRWLDGAPWPALDAYLRKMGIGRPVELPMIPPPPYVLPGRRRSWWALLILLAYIWKRWTDAKKAETDEALGVDSAPRGSPWTEFV